MVTFGDGLEVPARRTLAGGEDLADDGVVGLDLQAHGPGPEAGCAVRVDAVEDDRDVSGHDEPFEWRYRSRSTAISAA